MLRNLKNPSRVVAAIRSASAGAVIDHDAGRRLRPTPVHRGKTILRLLTLAIAGALASPAQAATVTSSSFATVTLGRQDDAQPMIFLDLFDSQLGDLTSATLVLDVSSAFSFFVGAHSSPQFAGVSMASTIALSSSMPGLGTLLDGSLNPTMAPRSFPPTNLAVLLGPFTDSESVTFTFSLPAVLSEFRRPGGGQFNVFCNWRTDFAVLTSTLDVIEPTVQDKCAATIEYTYSSAQGVPEPAPLPLIGLAALGLYGTTRRRVVRMGSRP